MWGRGAWKSLLSRLELEAKVDGKRLEGSQNSCDFREGDDVYIPACLQFHVALLLYQQIDCLVVEKLLLTGTGRRASFEVFVSESFGNFVKDRPLVCLSFKILM